MQNETLTRLMAATGGAPTDVLADLSPEAARAALEGLDPTGAPDADQMRLLGCQAVLALISAGHPAEAAAEALWDTDETEPAEAATMLARSAPALAFLEAGPHTDAAIALAIARAGLMKRAAEDLSGPAKENLIDAALAELGIREAAIAPTSPNDLRRSLQFQRANLSLDRAMWSHGDPALAGANAAIDTYRRLHADWDKAGMAQDALKAAGNLAQALQIRARLLTGPESRDCLADAIAQYLDTIARADALGEDGIGGKARFSAANTLFQLATLTTGAERADAFSRAITLFTELATLWQADDKRGPRIKALVNCATVLHFRARTRTGAAMRADLNQALDLAGQAISQYREPGNAGDLARAWTSKATAHWSLAKRQTGAESGANYDSALAAHGEAATLHRNSGAREGLANALSDRGIVLASRAATRTGAAALADVNEAIGLFRAAQQEYRALDATMPVARNATNLATALSERADHVPDDRAIADLTEALAVSAEALEIWTTVGNPAMCCEIGGEQAAYLWARGRRRSGAARQADLDEALRLFEQAESALDPARDAYGLAILHENHALTLTARAEKADAEAARGDLRAAIVHCDQALAIWSTPDDRPLALMVLLKKADALLRLALIDGDDGSAAEAVALYAEVLAARDRASEPDAWLRAAAGQAEALFAARAPEAATAHEALLDNGLQQVFAQPDAAAQDVALRRLSGAGDRLALLRARAGDADGALAAVSLGRGVRAARDLALAAADGTLAGTRDRADALRAELRQLADLQSDPGDEAEALAAERTRLVQALDATTASLDTALGDLLGGGRLPQPTAADLCRALGPQDSIAIPVVTAQGGGVLVIRDAGTGPAAHWLDLPDLNDAAVSALVEAEGSGWLSAYDQGFAQGPGQIWDPASATARAWMRALEHLMSSLWSVLMGPLHRYLGDSGLVPGGTAQVVLMPPGRLAGLPLGSAWRDTDAGKRPFLADWVVSLAQSPAAWLASHDALCARADAPERLLAVSDPTEDLAVARVPRLIDGERRLERLLDADGRVQIEAGWENPASPLFDKAARQELRHRAATVAEVCNGMQTASHAVFFCHGGWNRNDGAQSGLLLAATDGKADDNWPGDLLTLERMDKENANTDRLRVAVLAACETAPVGLSVPDDFNGFAHGLALRVPAVMSTLFPVTPSMTALVARATLVLHLGRCSADNATCPARPMAEALTLAQRAAAAGGAVALDHIVRTGAPHPDPAGLLADAVTSPEMAALTPIARSEAPMRAPGPARPDHLDPEATRHPFYWAAMVLIGC